MLQHLKTYSPTDNYMYIKADLQSHFRQRRYNTSRCGIFVLSKAKRAKRSRAACCRVALSLGLYQSVGLLSCYEPINNATMRHHAARETRNLKYFASDLTTRRKADNVTSGAMLSCR